MRCLLDTGILLRMVDIRDALHASVVDGVNLLAGQRTELFTATQNVAEFWNVATRLLSDNGLALETSAVLFGVEHIIQRTCGVLKEPESMFETFKYLGRKYQFRGKQVHDARLVALMLCAGVNHILTLNDRDFRRYEPEGIVVHTPASLTAGA